MMGAQIYNNVVSVDVDAVYLYALTETSATFVVRVVKLDEDFKKERVITATPYFVAEIDGEETVVYGTAQTASYNAILAQFNA